MTDCSDDDSRICLDVDENKDPITGAYQICSPFDPNARCNQYDLTDPDENGIVWAIYSDCSDDHTRRCKHVSENFNYDTGSYINCELVAP